MRYSKTSSTVASKTAGLLLACAASFFAAQAANADVMQDCLIKEKTVAGVHECVIATEQRSVREMRERSVLLTKQLRQADDKAAFRTYVAGESSLIRERAKLCDKAEKMAIKEKNDPEQARLSCQADFNFAHLADLSKRYPVKD